MRICATLIAGLLLAGCASMVSERTTVVTPDGDEVDSAVAREAGGERLICSKDSVVGTRLPKRRTCRTAAEWEKIGEQSREEVDRAQRGTLPNAAQDGT